MTKERRTISSIKVSDEMNWSNAPYLTIDIDWAHDDVLAETIELVEQYRVPTTWFVTHDTPLLKQLRKNPEFELGIHPNFNFLLAGDDRKGRNATEVLDGILAIVPEAKSVRSHSTTQNSYLLELFERRGLTHECNTFIPAESGIELKPWQLWHHITRVPYLWEDDAACLFEPPNCAWNMSRLLGLSGIKVFDFHPIHIFLNTENLNRYENTRQWHRCPQLLREHRYDGVGTRTRFLEFLCMGSQARFT